MSKKKYDLPKTIYVNTDNYINYDEIWASSNPADLIDDYDGKNTAKLGIYELKDIKKFRRKPSEVEEVK